MIMPKTQFKPAKRFVPVPLHCIKRTKLKCSIEHGNVTQLFKFSCSYHYSYIAELMFVICSNQTLVKQVELPGGQVVKTTRHLLWVLWIIFVLRVLTCEQYPAAPPRTPLIKPRSMLDNFITGVLSNYLCLQIKLNDTCLIDMKL